MIEIYGLNMGCKNPKKMKKKMHCTSNDPAGLYVKCKKSEGESKTLS